MIVPGTVTGVQAKHVYARRKHAFQSGSAANRGSQGRHNFCSGHEGAACLFREGQTAPTECSVERKNRLVFLGALFESLLGALFGSRGVLDALILLLEAVHAALGIDQLLAAGEERVTVRADFHADVALMG